METLSALIFGMISMACLVVSLAFLRFWKLSHDRFFALFALSFALQACVRVALGLVAVDNEGRTYLYWVRLLSYVIILVAILDKNRPRAPKKLPGDS